MGGVRGRGRIEGQVGGVRGRDRIDGWGENEI